LAERPKSITHGEAVWSLKQKRDLPASRVLNRFAMASEVRQQKKNPSKYRGELAADNGTVGSTRPYIKTQIQWTSLDFCALGESQERYFIYNSCWLVAN
jgi:hypothetical protein